MPEYLYEFDDPYKILAGTLVGYHRPADIVRLLSDDSYIFTLIAKETRAQDMRGRFTDCIIEDILTSKRRMEYMQELDKLSDYYYSKLDKTRLRKEIKKILSDSGIELQMD